MLLSKEDQTNKELTKLEVSLLRNLKHNLDINFKLIAEPRFNQLMILEEYRIFRKLHENIRPMVNYGSRILTRREFKKITKCMRKSASKGHEYNNLTIRLDAKSGEDYSSFSLCKTKILPKIWMFQTNLQIERFVLKKKDIQSIIVMSRHLIGLSFSLCKISGLQLTKSFFNTNTQVGVNLQTIVFIECVSSQESDDDDSFYLIKSIMDGVLNSSLQKFLHRILFRINSTYNFKSVVDGIKNYENDQRLKITNENETILFNFISNLDS
ncbi:unnamed protein product [Moneuplotes crassus]|uniref:Uncharacterized protein n=1 Tax=Euplotes crassus TaxID=5936 RepID=A0AAD1UMG6_EUPCR|nr:unnamed protein product [Moneuplotes crassus]